MKNLSIWCENYKLYGRDEDTGVEYRISWCSNGQYSHYVLSRTDNDNVGQYVFEKHPLFLLIKRAEYRLIYKVGKVECDNMKQ